ncbi:MAG: 50S ribosomal protein L10 [Acidobacteria bacterium]|nr:50S ribosomal protein L10 [Acidobacteriota bacterium]
MNREEKKQEIERLQAELAKAASVFVVNFEKIPVSEDWELRNHIRAAGGKYSVVKNTLAELGAKGTVAEALVKELTGPTALATTTTNPVSLAKALSNYAKANPNFTFRSGMVDGRVISIAEINELANLPSKEELLAKIMYVVHSPARGIASATQSVIRSLAIVLNRAVAENKFQQ